MEKSKSASIEAIKALDFRKIKETLMYPPFKPKWPLSYLWSLFTIFAKHFGFVPAVGQGWPAVKADLAEKWLKNFLILYVKYPHENLVPHQLIDAIWHTWILDTMKYEEDCAQCFGNKLHHDPYFDGTERDGSLVRTNQLFRIEFGEDYEELDLNSSVEIWMRCKTTKCKPKCKPKCRPK